MVDGPSAFWEKIGMTKESIDISTSNSIRPAPMDTMSVIYGFDQ